MEYLIPCRLALFYLTYGIFTELHELRFCKPRFGKSFTVGEAGPAVVDPAVCGVQEEKQGRDEQDVRKKGSEPAAAADKVRDEKYRQEDDANFRDGKWKGTEKSPDSAGDEGVDVHAVPFGKSDGCSGSDQKHERRAYERSGCVHSPFIFIFLRGFFIHLLQT